MALKGTKQQIKCKDGQIRKVFVCNESADGALVCVRMRRHAGFSGNGKREWAYGRKIWIKTPATWVAA